jgi:hypothetical protein
MPSPHPAEIVALELRLLDPEVRGGDIEAVAIADDVVLVTYRAADTLRSSLWVRGDDGWRVRFHQGTPAGTAVA